MSPAGSGAVISRATLAQCRNPRLGPGHPRRRRGCARAPRHPLDPFVL